MILKNIGQLVKSKSDCLIVHERTNDLANGTQSFPYWGMGGVPLTSRKFAHPPHHHHHQRKFQKNKIQIQNSHYNLHCKNCILYAYKCNSGDNLETMGQELLKKNTCT